MGKRKPIINAKEAAEGIRAGMSDEDLMEKYDISAKGLESLFKKLVRAGFIEQAELNQRLIGSQRSHSVVPVALTDLISLTAVAEVPDAAIPTIKVDVNEALRAIKGGSSDEAIMRKFGLSARGLSSLFNKLLLAGHLGQEEIDRRRRSFDWAELAVGPSNAESPPGSRFREEDPEEQSWPGGSSYPRGWFQSPFVLLFAAGFGALGGIVAVLVVLALLEGRPWQEPAAFSATDRAVEVAFDADEVAAEQFAKMLDDIARNRGELQDTEDVPERTALRACLQRCRREFASPDASDEGFLINCRMQCVNRHSEPVRRLREQYYGH